MTSLKKGSPARPLPSPAQHGPVVGEMGWPHTQTLGPRPSHSPYSPANTASLEWPCAGVCVPAAMRCRQARAARRVGPAGGGTAWQLRPRWHAPCHHLTTIAPPTCQPTPTPPYACAVGQRAGAGAAGSPPPSPLQVDGRGTCEMSAPGPASCRPAACHLRAGGQMDGGGGGLVGIWWRAAAILSYARQGWY